MNRAENPVNAEYIDKFSINCKSMFYSFLVSYKKSY